MSVCIGERYREKSVSQRERETERGGIEEGRGRERDREKEVVKELGSGYMRVVWDTLNWSQNLDNYHLQNCQDFRVAVPGALSAF